MVNKLELRHGLAMNGLSKVVSAVSVEGWVSSVGSSVWVGTIGSCVGVGRGTIAVGSWVGRVAKAKTIVGSVGEDLSVSISGPLAIVVVQAKTIGSIG